MAHRRITGVALLRPENRSYFDKETLRCIRFICNQVRRGNKWDDAITKARGSYGSIVSTQATYEIGTRVSLK